jgi:molybdate transport system ATP-binding protein
VRAEPILDCDVTLGLGAFALQAALRTSARRMAIVGPSGSGKSTLLRVLAGLERGARGHVRFDGVAWHEDARTLVPPHRRRVGWVPQDVRLFPHRTVLQNLAFGGAPCEDAVRLATRLGVAALLDRRPRHLSGGEAQRVALARALLANPRLLLLDEPFAALDRARRADVAELLREWLAASQATLVLVSHDERDVALLADEVFEMSEGVLRPASPASPAR